MIEIWDYYLSTEKYKDANFGPAFAVEPAVQTRIYDRPPYEFPDFDLLTDTDQVVRDTNFLGISFRTLDDPENFDPNQEP